MKNLSNLGKALNKAEQKTINGGNNNGCPPPRIRRHTEDFECGGDTGYYCTNEQQCCYGFCV